MPRYTFPSPSVAAMPMLERLLGERLATFTDEGWGTDDAEVARRVAGLGVQVVDAGEREEAPR